MAPGYPPFRGPRLSVREAVKAGGGHVAGRLEEGPGGLRLRDSGGEVPLAAISPVTASAGDWVSGRLAPDPAGGFRLEELVLHAPRLAPSPDPGLGERLEVLARRSRIVAAARDYFRGEDFLEVETPARVPCPGLEPHLRAFGLAGSPPRWLITSPELHLKRLLAAGAERVVEFARAFRDEERGALHRTEFLLLEWYRAFAPLETLERDCELLVSACATGAGASVAGCDLSPPFDRTTVRQAVRELTGLDLAGLREREALAAALGERGLDAPAGDKWDDLFFRLWIAEVEPQLGRRRPVFVRDYPASQAALARVRLDPEWPVAERFELYAAGIELANAFHELNDPEEQRRRHLADQEARRSAGAEVYPLDESFLAALRSGMPPSSGIAFGLDRLALLLTGADSLDELHPFSAG